MAVRHGVRSQSGLRGNPPRLARPAVGIAGDPDDEASVGLADRIRAGLTDQAYSSVQVTRADGPPLSILAGYATLV